jgi:hypothetical protein
MTVFSVPFCGYPPDSSALAQFGMRGNAAIPAAWDRSPTICAGAACEWHCIARIGILLRISRLQRL